jgi:aspartate kinase
MSSGSNMPKTTNSINPATKKAGHQVVVVVSAMGDTTDELIDLANQVSPLPNGRELDMLLTAGERISMALLAMAISNLGH